MSILLTFIGGSSESDKGGPPRVANFGGDGIYMNQYNEVARKISCATFI